MDKIKLLDTVALLEDLPSHGLVKGQVGVAVEQLSEDVFEVEFCNKNGETLAMLPLNVNVLMILYYDTVDA